MRIVHCLHNYYPARGGAEWLMQNVSERMAKRGHEVRVIATNAYSVEDYFLPGRGKILMAAGEETVNGVSVTRVPFSRRGALLLNILRAVSNRTGTPMGDWLKMVSWGPRSRAYYREVLRSSGGADVIATSPLPTMNVLYAWRASQKKNIPLIIIPCFHTEDKWTFHNRLYFRWLREADAVITLTEWEKTYLEREAGVKEEKLHAIGVGIDFDAPSADTDYRKKSGIQEKEVVLFLGQHGLHKGIIHLIRAMEHMWEKRADVALVIAGNPTAHTLEVEKKIAALGPEAQKRVHLIKGFPEEEKRALLKAADVFVSVSFMESFGIVFLEAWREGLPVIGCRRGGSSRIIDEHRDGLLVEFGKPRELAGAVLELLENPEVRRKMGESGRRKAAENYTWDKIIPLWEKVYENVVQQNGKNGI